MQPLLEHRVELAGFATRALELEGEGTPIVLLHGYGDSADTWRNVLDRLARQDRRALAIDLPGFGTADPLRPEGSMLEQLGDAARAAVEYVLEQAGGTHREAILAGNSLGGTVTLRAAQDPDAPLAGIVPIAPAGLDMPRWFAIIEREPLIRLIMASPVPVPEPVLRAAVGAVYRQLAFAKPRAAAAEVVRAFTDHHATKSAVKRILDNGRRLLPELDEAYDLAAIECPVLLVWGDRDRMVTHRGAQVITDALPATTYELLPGIGHCPQIEAADRVAALLLEFAASPSQKVA